MFQIQEGKMNRDGFIEWSNLCTMQIYDLAHVYVRHLYKMNRKNDSLYYRVLETKKIVDKQ